MGPGRERIAWAAGLVIDVDDEFGDDLVHPAGADHEEESVNDEGEECVGEEMFPLGDFGEADVWEADVGDEGLAARTSPWAESDVGNEGEADGGDEGLAESVGDPGEAVVTINDGYNIRSVPMGSVVAINDGDSEGVSGEADVGDEGLDETGGSINASI